MTKEQLSAKIMKLAIITGACGGTTQALGNPEHPMKWLTIGILTGLLITLHEWRKVAIILITEYKRLKKLDSDKKSNSCTDK